MDKDKKNGPVELPSKARTKRVTNMGKAYTDGLTVVFTKEN